MKEERLPAPQADACRSTSEEEDYYGSEYPVEPVTWREKLFLVFLAALAALNLWFILASGPK
jgi:hypothetical protein